MEGFIRCKACDYVWEASKGYHICPACGVKETAFEPYKFKISEERRKILNLHIHPITVHFSETFSVINVFILLVCIFLTGDLFNKLMVVYNFNSILLPFSVIASFITGIYDGKIRFKSATTPILKTKIYISIAHFFLSIAMGVISWGYTVEGTVFWVAFVIAVLNMASGIWLGKLGGKLMESKMVGK